MNGREPLRLALLLWLVSCGGKLTVDSKEPGYRPDTGGAATSSGATTTGGAASTLGGSGAAAGSAVNGGGEQPISGARAVGGADENGGSGSELGGDSSSAGAGGALSCDELPDLEGDCHSVSCGPSEVATRHVDQNDLPTLENPCLAGTCNALGSAGSEPRDARTSCSDGALGVMCNGIGACVECLKSEDCPSKQNCSKQQACVPEPCTDANCGGACPSCENGKKCLVDSDCASAACDSLTLTCIEDSCKDHHQDHNETDADCGGGICHGCALSQGCGLNLDCASNACDTLTLQCVGNQCADHRQDGDETDKDCGGGFCMGCTLGKKCVSSFDCSDGLCTSTAPHVCYAP